MSSLKSQVSGLQTQVRTDNAAVATARTKAATAQQTANANAAAAYKSKQASTPPRPTRARRPRSPRRRRQWRASQQTLNQELGQVQANAISSDGTFVVGQDIKSGTYAHQRQWECGC